MKAARLITGPFLYMELRTGSARAHPARGYKISLTYVQKLLILDFIVCTINA